MLHLNAASILLRELIPSSVIRTGQTNHLRVDCDQWKPGFATLRLCVNGQFMGSASTPMNLAASREGGLSVVSSGPAGKAKFTNWTVSKLAG